MRSLRISRSPCAAPPLLLATSMSNVTRAEEAPRQAGLLSIRALLRPGLALQSLAIVVVLAYYFVPATAGFFAF